MSLPLAMPVNPRNPTSVSVALSMQDAASSFVEPITPFCDYLITKSRDIPLERYFRQPDDLPPSPIDSYPVRPLRAGYRQLPSPLRTAAMLRSAKDYFEENKSRQETSIIAVKVLAILFFVPALGVFALRCLWKSFGFSSVRL